jgi:hypothetical protein
MRMSGVSFAAEPLEGSRFCWTFLPKDEGTFEATQDIFTTNKTAVGLRGVIICTD